jgi:CheY-like chemotaxis protein
MDDTSVLLIEDNADDVFLMRRALKKSGLPWSMQVVTDGQEAMNFLAGVGKYADRAQFPLPSLVFLDLKLPYVPGFEVLAWIQGRPELSRIPVLVLTSSPEERDQRKAHDLGAQGYFTKPPTEDWLRQVARLATDGREGA